jgi:hypothetical protein
VFLRPTVRIIPLPRIPSLDNIFEQEARDHPADDAAPFEVFPRSPGSPTGFEPGEAGSEEPPSRPDSPTGFEPGRAGSEEPPSRPDSPAGFEPGEAGSQRTPSRPNSPTGFEPGRAGSEEPLGRPDSPTGSGLGKTGSKEPSSRPDSPTSFEPGEAGSEEPLCRPDSPTGIEPEEVGGWAGRELRWNRLKRMAKEIEESFRSRPEPEEVVPGEPPSSSGSQTGSESECYDSDINSGTSESPPDSGDDSRGQAGRESRWDRLKRMAKDIEESFRNRP